MPDPLLTATINAGGQSYTSWKSVQVQRTFGMAISVFQFTAAEPGPFGGGWESIRLKPGDPCEVLLGGLRVINGNITTRIASYDANSHDLIIAGQSLTTNLRSSVAIQPGTFNNNSFEQANRSVMAPHQSQLVIRNPLDIVDMPFANLVVQYGESVLEFAERTAKMRGMFLTDDADGNLVAGLYDDTAASSADLVEGRNILRATGKLDDQSLWSQYSMAGQQPGTDQTRPTRDISATVTNPNGQNNRIYLGISEHPGSVNELQVRADIEAKASLWPCVECSVTVAGWIRPDGQLWDIYNLVSLYSPSIFPNESGSMTLGVQAVTYNQDRENGTTTTLDLRLKDLLTKTPNPANVPADVPPGPSGNVVDSPNPNLAQPDPPDTGG